MPIQVLISKNSKETCFKHGVLANVDLNARNKEINDEKFLDEYSIKNNIVSKEPMHGWILSGLCLTGLITIVSGWKIFNYIAFIVVLLKKIYEI